MKFWSTEWSQFQVPLNMWPGWLCIKIIFLGEISGYCHLFYKFQMFNLFDVRMHNSTFFFNGDPIFFSLYSDRFFFSNNLRKKVCFFISKMDQIFKIWSHIKQLVFNKFLLKSLNYSIKYQILKLHFLYKLYF